MFKRYLATSIFGVALVLSPVVTMGVQAAGAGAGSYRVVPGLMTQFARVGEPAPQLRAECNLGKGWCCVESAAEKRSYCVRV